MLRFISLRGVRAHMHKNVVHLQHRLNVIYSVRSRVVELLLKYESNQQIMQNNVETQPKHMYSLYIGSLCNIVLSMARFTCIVPSQEFVKIYIAKHRALPFIGAEKKLRIVFSLKKTIKAHPSSH